MATVQELKDRIDLHDLAEKLGLERPGGRGNYRSPGHEDKNPSLSIFNNGQRWKDHSSGRSGSCIDLMMYVREIEVDEAIRELHSLYGWENENHSPQNAAPRKRTLPEFIADRCLKDPSGCMDYLTGRGIPEAVVQQAIKNKTLGWNTWTADQATAKPGREPIKPGEFGWGGPGAAFIVRDLHPPGDVMAVDMRYVDADLNGGVKTQTQGEKERYPWFSNRRSLLKAETVYVVESPINALSIEACNMPYTAALAVRGVGTIESIDWQFLHNKRVVLCFDNDEPDEKGHRPGPEAAWRLYDLLSSLNISAHLVDQSDWEHNDVNDILQAVGPHELHTLLCKLEPWAIPGLPGNKGKIKGKSRLWLPGHDYSIYWRYRCKEDFTSYIRELGQEEDDNGEAKTKYDNVAGFRIANLQRVQIAGPNATMTGDIDLKPNTMFACAIQTPGQGNTLVRKVFETDKLHNAGQWNKLGKVYDPDTFARLVNILERKAASQTLHATNFVGLAWRDGKPVVNEGPDCFFSNPKQQCPYHNLTFPSGSIHDARRVISAYQSTFGQNAALMLLVWALGGHLKAFMGFWPHMILQADKGAGKSVLIKRLERTIAMTMFSGQNIQTEYRLLTSLSATSHPIAWEELSARKKKIINMAISQLQECYQHAVTYRGTDQTEFLLSAPVLLAGEEVDAPSLTGKACAINLVQKGPLMPEDLPRFPVRQWLDYLAGLTRNEVREVFKTVKQYAQDSCSAQSDDDGARRMIDNYSAVMTAWQLLCTFAGISDDLGNFKHDMVTQMNTHIQETSQDREPWVWILELICSEISAGRVAHPYLFDSVDGELCLVMRTSHIMDHIAHTPALRDIYDGLPVKSDRVFRRQLLKNKMLVGNSEKNVERTIAIRGSINTKTRIRRMTPISVERMESYGIAVPVDQL